MRTNVAQRCLDYYSSKDFESNYAQVLFEDFSTNENEIIERIVKICLDNDHYCNRQKAKQIYDHISDNFESFVGDMCNYWVGYNCLESVSFGEQEEQLSGYDMNMSYLKRVFNREGFIVKGEYAYHDMVGEGLKIDLKFTDEILAILNESDTI